MSELVPVLENATEGSVELDKRICEILCSPAGSQKLYMDFGRFGMFDMFTHPNGQRLNMLRYSTSLDAAMTLVPERGEGDLLLRAILERKPLHSGPAWIAEIREHAKDGGHAIAHTAALAICAAALRFRTTV